MKLSTIFASFIITSFAIAETEEIRDLSNQIEESNSRLKELIYDLQMENLSEKDKADLEFINESFQRNNEGIRYYL